MKKSRLLCPASGAIVFFFLPLFSGVLMASDWLFFYDLTALVADDFGSSIISSKSIYEELISSLSLFLL